MNRSISSKMLTALTASSLFNKKIQPDCVKQKVFLASRGNEIDFYHKGGRLFCFDGNGFKTHYKYASMITKKDHDYFSEQELDKFDISHDFKKNYQRIKENCSKYSGVEALGVSNLYHKYSYLSENDIVVLDIEVSFKSFTDDKNQDRIDILLYNKSTNTLKFVEAKHFSNKEIWSTKTPPVVSQINRYEEQVLKRRKEIIAEYSKYVQSLNKLFSISLPIPKYLDDKVTLLIFGFDSDQRGGRLASLVTKNKHFNGVNCYPVGNIKGKQVVRGIWNAGAINV